MSTPACTRRLPRHCIPTARMAISPIPEIIAELKAGRMVVLVDEEDRENEGDLVVAADFVTPEIDQFHGALRPRPDLHADHRGARRANSSSRR